MSRAASDLPWLILSSRLKGQVSGPSPTVKSSVLREQRTEQPDLLAQDNFLVDAQVPSGTPSQPLGKRGGVGKVCLADVGHHHLLLSLDFSGGPSSMHTALTEQRWQYLKTIGKPDSYLLFLMEVLNVVFEK